MSRFNGGPVAMLAFAAACASEPAGRPDAGRDASSSPDAGAVLASTDAGEDAGALLDASPPDVPAVVGEISGACGVLDDELSSSQPSTFVNHIDFAEDGFSNRDRDRLSEGARAILDRGNAGGSSVLSEAFAFEILARCEGATLLLSEREVEYQPADSKKTDLVVDIDGVRIGVSVTRALGFPRDAPYDIDRARGLLTTKLEDVLVSSDNVIARDAWTKQILHVIAYGPMHAESLLAAESMIDASVRADTILWVSVSDGEDAFLYE